MHNPLLCASTLCRSYAIKVFLLINFSVKSKQLSCSVHVESQTEQKMLLGFTSIPLYYTRFQCCVHRQHLATIFGHAIFRNAM